MSHTIIQEYQKKFKKSKVPVLRAGMTVKITQKFLEGKKERQQLFQGIVIKVHEKTSMNATFTVRKIVDGIGVEKIFSIHAPSIDVEIVRSAKVRRSKLFYMRTRSGKSARLRENQVDFKELLLDTGSKHVADDAAVEEAVQHAKEVEAAEAKPAEVTEAPKAAEAPEVASEEMTATTEATNEEKTA